NYLNNHLSQSSSVQQTVLLKYSPLRADVDGDGYVLPLDALLIINRLNGRSSDAAVSASTPNDDAAQPEGEADRFDSALVDLILTENDSAKPSSNRLAGPRAR